MEQFPAKIDDEMIATFVRQGRIERSKAFSQAFNTAVSSVKNIFSQPTPAPHVKPHC